MNRLSRLSRTLNTRLSRMARSISPAGELAVETSETNSLTPQTMETLSEQKEEGQQGWVSWFSEKLPSLPSWKPTSEEALEEAERNVLKYVKTPYHDEMVEVQPGVKIRTAVFNPPTESEENATSEKYPVVMVHGFGGGLGLFVKNFDSVSERVPLYAFDLLGFGRSTRVEFSSDPQVAEQQFIDSIEQWRKKVGLKQFVLLGHSFGAYLSCSYAIKHPESVRHLVLVDPWGFAERTDADVERQRSYPWYVRSIASVVGKFNPLSGLRAAGPLGPRIFEKIRGDLDRSFSDFLEDPNDSITQYLYHCNAQNPTGEIAWDRMTLPFTFPKNPMLKRIPSLSSSIPVSFIFGKRTWMDKTMGEKTRLLRGQESYTHTQFIPGAGHHVYANNTKTFNMAVAEILAKVDEGKDQHGSPPGLNVRF